MSSFVDFWLENVNHSKNVNHTHLHSNEWTKKSFFAGHRICSDEGSRFWAKLKTVQIFGICFFKITSAVLSGKKLSKCGDCADLENICKNLMELDISNNLFEDWNEVNYILDIYLIY